MVERQRSPLSIGQVQLAKRYRGFLEWLHNECAEPFKVRDVRQQYDDIGQGDLMKLKKSGLLRNESVATDEPKDWFLSQHAKRWLDSG